MKRYLHGLFESAYALNRENILRTVGLSRADRMLDLGCDDGVWTSSVARAANASAVCGVEIVAARAALARLRGIDVREADLTHALGYDEADFDLVHANQVIEHVPDVDTFTSEIFRVLRPGGRVVVSTENGSSWHNVVAAIMGWQTFSLSNVSRLRAGLGNPMSLMRGQTIELGSWTHKVIFNYRGLKEFFELHGFEDVSIAGAGYYPLPSVLGRWDVRHAHFITVTGTKPLLRSTGA